MEEVRRKWNDLYSGEEYLFGTEPNAWLARNANCLQKGWRVLFVADGEGRNSVWCAKRGIEADAFDLSEEGIKKAEALAAKAGVKVNFSVYSIDSWPWTKEAYDAVVIIFTQFATPNMRARLFARTVETLKPGGILILQGYRPKQLEYKSSGPLRLESLYTEELLRESFKTMEILKLESYDTVIKEGTRHDGMSALIGLVARKKEK